MVGGRVGYDGIHGATFSSLELTEESPSSAVQIGDPITQKKMLDMLLEARDMGLITCITDNGAGGLSSSIGEMAEYTNGCMIDLAKVPLKQPGLSPWEILVSESQERMTVAVKPEDQERFDNLAKLHEVEATPVAEFTSTGMFHVMFDQSTVAYLPIEFLHDGVPQLELHSEWKTPEHIFCFSKQFFNAFHIKLCNHSFSCTCATAQTNKRTATFTHSLQDWKILRGN